MERIQKAHPDVDIYCGAVDDHLNEHGYIVPGLGDARRPDLRDKIKRSPFTCVMHGRPVPSGGKEHTMAPEQTNAKRHGPNRATTVICLVLILAAALVIARMVKFRSQVDVTLPAVLWEDGEATAVNTTLHFHGEMVKQWGQDDSFSGYLELEEQPLHL